MDVSNQLISEHAYYVDLLKGRKYEICMRLNKLEDYKKVYEDVYSWMLTKTGCYEPSDI